MSNAYSYRNPLLSLWQSAAAKVHPKQATAQNRRIAMAASATARAAAGVDLMAPVDMVGVPLAAGRPEDARAAVSATPDAREGMGVSVSGVLHTAEDCAKVVGEFLLAEITGNKQESQDCQDELAKSECDPGWAACLAIYLADKALLQSPMYRPNQNPVFDLDSKTRIAIVGDWGTGDEVATNLLTQVKTFTPDILMHLGDVYYSGTQDEQQSNFLNICRNILGNVRLFSLCGNHDMYAGGQGYYWMLDQIGQQASYFCLKNANWQFLAMDTGYNDRDPFTVSTDMTSLYTSSTWNEEDWLLDKINLAPAGSKLVLLSHHPLFSPFASVGTADGGVSYGYNKNLRATFQAVMAKVAWWFWGHQHIQAIFDPYPALGLQRGRCVGASAVPVFEDQQSYTTDTSLATYGGAKSPTWDTKAQLGNNGTDYNNGFAIMTLDGASANVDYYQVVIGQNKAVRFDVDDKV
jgi:calcineurin-like phosphoesterase family protein